MHPNVFCLTDFDCPKCCLCRHGHVANIVYIENSVGYQMNNKPTFSLI